MRDYPIKNLRVVNFRSIVDESFEFRPLTIFTGKNGSGKSTVLNALFFCASFYYINKANKADNAPDIDYDSNFSLNQDKIEILLNGYETSILCKREKSPYSQSCQTKRKFHFERDFYYLNADRSPIETMKIIEKTDLKFGVGGQFVEQYFLNNSTQKIANFNKLEIETLDYHIGFWIEKILNLRFDFKTIESQQRVRCDFYSKDLKANIDSTRVATGMNYLTKILIVGLTCKKGDVFVVENPEIHLHPRAISNLAEFFAMLARGGVQIVLETHDTRLVSKLRILIHKKELSPDDVMIYYKDSVDSKFESVFINDNGFFVNDKGQRISFPQGFMDVDLLELMEVR